MWSKMCPHCLATSRTFCGILHHSRLYIRTFPGLFADNTRTLMVLSGESMNRTLFPRLTRIVGRNGTIHFGNPSFSCPCSSGRQALREKEWCGVIFVSMHEGTCKQISPNRQAECYVKTVCCTVDWLIVWNIPILIPLDLNIILGPYKFSLQATVDRQGNLFTVAIILLLSIAVEKKNIFIVMMIELQNAILLIHVIHLLYI